MFDVSTIIQSVGTVASVLFSVFAIVRSSKIKQNEDLKEMFKNQVGVILKLDDELQAYVLENSRDIMQLQTQVENIKENIDNKLSQVLDKLHD